MPTMISDLFVRLSAMTSPYTAAMIEASDEGEAFAETNKASMDAVKASNEEGAGSFGLLGKAAAGIGVGFIAVSALSMKWATSFQSQMELLNTQAGVSQGQIAGLSSGVLSLAGQVGFSPDSLAQALFHVESSFASVGITGPAALNLLKISAEGAATGHADLVDVTNALDAAVVSGIPGVQNYSQAMGILNATVGAGDMTMQDLANAFSSGLLASVKGYGLSITDVGAALATFGDNNIRGATAATDLRMSVQSMAVPASTAGTELKKLGLTSTTLATDMQTGGLMKALDDLKTHMDAANVSTVQQGQVLTDLFGKKAGTGMNVLIDQLGRLQSKYPVLTQGADQFANDWTTTKATVKQQLDEIGSGAQAAGIKFGTYLLPYASKFLGLVISQGSSLMGTLSKDATQLAQGFTGKLPSAPAPAAMHSSGLNRLQQTTVAPPAATLTGWQKFGQIIHTLVTDFSTFGQDASTAFGDLVKAAQPAAAVFGGAFVLALTVLGTVLKNDVGPALVAFASFLKNHGPDVKLFAEVILTALVAKFTILAGIKSITALTGLATQIVNFPFKQAGQIQTALTGLKVAWSGKEAKNGEDAVLGLKGAFSNLAGAVSSGASTAGGALKTGLSGMANIAGQQVAFIKGKFAQIMPTKLDFHLMLESVKDAGKQVGSTIAGWGGTIAKGAKTAFGAIGSAASTVATTAVSWGSSIAKGIASGVSTAASGLATFATNAAQAAASMAASAWSGITGTVSTVTSAISSAAAATWRLVTAGTAAAVSAARQAIAWTADKVATIGATIADGAMTVATWLLNAAMAVDPVVLIIIAITALVAVFVILWVKCAGFRDFWKGLWHDISAAAETAWNWLYGNVFQPVGHFFDTVIMGALNGAKKLWDTVWNGFQSTVATVWGYLKPIFTAIGNAISTVSGALGTVAHLASSVGSGIGGALSDIGFADGGFVPGARGAATLAIVHGGEYVVSNAMLSGNAPIDNRALAGALTAGSGGGGSAGPLAVQAGGGGTTTVIQNFVTVTCGPQLSSDSAVQAAVQTAMTRLGMRNSTTYTPYQASRARSS